MGKKMGKKKNSRASTKPKVALLHESSPQGQSVHNEAHGMCSFGDAAPATSQGLFSFGDAAPAMSQGLFSFGGTVPVSPTESPNSVSNLLPSPTVPGKGQVGGLCAVLQIVPEEIFRRMSGGLHSLAKFSETNATTRQMVIGYLKGLASFVVIGGVEVRAASQCMHALVTY